jgi:eukaryotic-like serine/threonine-protein kinase
MTSDDDERDDDDVDDLLRQVSRAPVVSPPRLAMLGRYRIVRRIGAGGMGVVYEAEDTALTRRVALKVLPSDRLDVEGRRRKLLREAQAASAVSHPNVATVYDVGEDHGRVYVAMELVRGETLRERLSRVVSPGEAVAIALGIARGISRAHAAGIVHRDVKPENVILDGETPKVLDFGLAANVASSTLDTLEPISGTPSYMSPEQVRGADVGPRSDVFALGIVLYEMLAGRRPFEGRTAMDVGIAIDRDSPPNLPPSVPSSIAEVVRRCLEKDPRRRPRDAGALVMTLERALRGERGLEPARQRAFAGAALLVILLLAGMFVVMRRQHPVPERTDAANESARIAFAEGLQAFRDGNWSHAVKQLRLAVARDPELASAHFRLALVMGIFGRVDETLLSLQRATSLRDRLTPRERALLEALAPLLQQIPMDVGETVKRLDGAIARDPTDPDLWFWKVRALWYRRDHAGQLEAATHLCELDPTSALGWRERAHALNLLGRVDDARMVFEECVAHAPEAVICVRDLALMNLHAGRCTEAEDGLRRSLARAPDDPDTHAHLASALYPRLGLEAARAAVDNETAIDGSRAARRSIALAVLAGDLARARDLALANRALLADKRSAFEHFPAELTLYEVAVEAGDRPTELARSFFARQAAWIDASGFPPGEGIDPTGLMLSEAFRGGVFDRRARDDELARWVSSRGNAFSAWVMAHALPAVTEGEANDALAVAPKVLAGSLLVRGIPDAAIGKLLLLARRPADAVPHLTMAAASCLAVFEPFAHTRAHLDLGRALEEIGDTDGACRAYDVVLSRWGAATLKSVSADAARARKRALCKKD